MRVIYSEQYKTACVVAHDSDSADDIICCAEENDATFEEDPDCTTYVVQLRPEIGPELWTESAIRRSIS